MDIRVLIGEFERFYEDLVEDPNAPDALFPVAGLNRNKKAVSLYHRCRKAGLSWQTHMLALWLGYEV